MTVEKQQVRHKEQDNKGYVTMYGVFKRALPYLEKECKKAGIRVPKYDNFSIIVRKFFDIIFNDVIYKYSTYKLPYRYGTITGVKTLCTRFNPTKTWWEVEDGKRVKKSAKVTINEFGGYYYHMFWELPQKFIAYRFAASKKWKKKIFFNVMEGGDYPIKE